VHLGERFYRKKPVTIILVSYGGKGQGIKDEKKWHVHRYIA